VSFGGGAEERKRTLAFAIMTDRHIFKARKKGEKEEKEERRAAPGPRNKARTHIELTEG